MRIDPILECFYKSLHKKPYATNNPSSGMYIYNSDEAIKKKYIQFNTPFESRWLAFDIDRPTGYYDWIDCNVPPPNIIIINPDTHKNSGRTHLLYGLENPVVERPIIKGIRYNKNARIAPIKLAKFIRKAMAIKLDADRSYPAVLCKNPLNDYWITTIGNSSLYNMESLSIGFEFQKDIKKPININNDSCALFNWLKDWSYTEFRKCNYNEELFAISCYKQAEDFTSNLSMSKRKINSIVKSVIKWVTINFSQDDFIGFCRRRGKAGNIKSIQIRKAKKENRNVKIIEYKLKYPQTTYSELAHIFNVSLGTICSISELRSTYEYII
jgi:hypothetical protein